MEELHQESLNWWKNKCSEAAVGAYMAASLNGLKRTALVQPQYNIRQGVGKLENYYVRSRHALNPKIIAKSQSQSSVKKY